MLIALHYLNNNSVSVEELSADTCICLRSEALRANNYASFKNVKFPRGYYQTNSSET